MYSGRKHASLAKYNVEKGKIRRIIKDNKKYNCKLLKIVDWKKNAIGCKKSSKIQTG